jgi:acetoin utilization deacetylase AcuC-like enzyme
MTGKTEPTGAPKTLVLVDDPLFDQHRGAASHPERPERLAAARRAVSRAASDALRLAPRDADDAELARAHAPAHLEALAALAGREAMVDADTYVSTASVAAARRAAGGAVSLVRTLLDPSPNAPRRGAALLRPPGHHATRDHAMGFCLLNNVAIAAHEALASGLSRVAIVDFDVHHGNGTEDVFAADPRVLFVSLHQYPLYPGTGALEDVGRGEGKGYTVNVPLSARATDAVYEAAFDSVVEPVLARFEPELVLVSAGFDAHERDPLAAMKLTARAYASMVASLARVADATAGGRLALLLEGGYDLDAIESSLEASIRAMLGERAAPAADAAPIGGRHRMEIDHARGVAARRWAGI